MDYTAVIREQITREVKQMTGEFRKKYRVAPQYVELGYFVNCHRGRPVFCADEKIEGMFWKQNGYASRSILVIHDGVPSLDEDGHPEDTNVETVESTW